MKRLFSRTLRMAAVLVLFFVVLLGVLQTGPGKSALASALSKLLSRSDNLVVRIEQISGWIPGDVRIGLVQVEDSKGEWLTARNLHCRWNIHELLGGRVRLSRLGADEIGWTRFPVADQTAVAREKKHAFSSALEIQLDGLNIDRLELGMGVAGMPLEYTVRSGGISLEKGHLSGGVAISGDAEGWVDIEASLADAARSELKLRAELEEMNQPTFGLDHLSGSGEATINSDGVAAVIMARLEEKGQTGTISTRLHYSARQLQLQQFRFASPNYSLGGDLSLGFSKKRIDLALNAELLDVHANSYALRGTASVSTANKTWSVDVKNIEILGWDAVVLSVSGSLSPVNVDLKGELKPFDVDQLAWAGLAGFNGRMSGGFSLSGPLDNPRMEAGVDILQFMSKKEALDELPKLDFSIVGGVADGRLFASTSLTNFSRGYLSASVEMPGSLSLSPLRFDFDPKKTEGVLDADLDLAVFNGLAFLDDQHVQGLLKVGLSRENQMLSGFLTLEHGQYEHYDWGILFRDCEAKLEATSKGFVIRHATATDGKTGRIEFSGNMESGVLGVQLDLAEAKIVQRPEVNSKISGRLKLAGRLSRPEITGRLVVDRADILPDNMVTPKPMLLTNYDARSAEDRTVKSQQRKPLPFGVNVRIEMPDQIYVNASLIDSVWGGTLQIKDAPQGLSVKGSVAPRRGYVDFIGKKFRLKQGTILFDGTVPYIPVFSDLTAEYYRSDFTARLILNGGVNDPQFRLESDPALPQDEILSHVLFNRDTSSISPYQAIQIAAAARQLSGGLSGPGFMYQFRQAIGIDTLEWREPDVAGGSSSVAAGKYITSDLYVEVSSTFGTEASTGMTAEYELNRHFSVESSTGPRMRPGIGVNWKNDY